MSKTAIIYARVSTTRQADNELPVESQIDECHKKAIAVDATVLKIFRDDGVSGTTSTRRSWQAALLFCETNQVDFFICWDTKRFARNHVDAVMNKMFLKKVGTEMVYASQSFAGEDGWLVEGMFQLFDEHQSRRIGRDTMRSMAKNASDGFFNGGRVPYGFKTEAFGKRKKLQAIPEEVAVVKTIFRWCLEGAGGKNIAERLNEAGVSKRGRRWDKASVMSVLRNPASIGQLTFTVGDNQIITPAHDSIISEVDYMNAQNVIESRSPVLVGGRPRSDAVFAGMLRCGSCGEAMITETATGRAGVRYHYYNCRSFLKGLGCASRRIPVSPFDEFILQGILTKVLTVENIGDILVGLKTYSSSWVRDHEAKLSSMNAEIATVETKLRRLYDSIEAGAGLVLSDVAPRIRELMARQEALRRELHEAEQAPTPIVTMTDQEVSGAAEILREMVMSCEDPKRVRGFLSPIIRRIVVNKGEAHVEYWPERIVNAKEVGGSQWDVTWLPDLGSNQGPTD